MVMGLPSSRGRTVRTFSDIPYMGYPQEVGGAYFTGFWFLLSRRRNRV